MLCIDPGWLSAWPCQHMHDVARMGMPRSGGACWITIGSVQVVNSIEASRYACHGLWCETAECGTLEE